MERADATVYRPATLVDLELVLRWQPGSIAAVLAAGDTTPTNDDSGQARTVLEHLVQLRAEVAALRDQVAELAGRFDEPPSAGPETAEAAPPSG